MAFSDSHIETTKRLAAQRQIDAALGHLHKSELEAAIALATAAEGLLPGVEARRVSAHLHDHPLSKRLTPMRRPNGTTSCRGASPRGTGRRYHR
jgi:hypothetical protein